MNMAFNPRHSLVQAYLSRQYVKVTVAPNDNLVQGMNSMVPFKILRLFNDAFYPKISAILQCTHWVYCSFILRPPHLAKHKLHLMVQHVP